MNQPWMERALTQLQTPFYLFDTDAAAAQVEALRKKLPDRVGLCYAVKANQMCIRDRARAAATSTANMSGWVLAVTVSSSLVPLKHCSEVPGRMASQASKTAFAAALQS